MGDLPKSEVYLDYLTNGESWSNDFMTVSLEFYVKFNGIKNFTVALLDYDPLVKKYETLPKEVRKIFGISMITYRRQTLRDL